MGTWAHRVSWSRPLSITIAGGGPVGLTLALLLDEKMGTSVTIQIYDGRWMRTDEGIVWRGPDQGNERRQQVVTLQSRQYLRLPDCVRREIGRDLQRDVARRA